MTHRLLAGNWNEPFLLVACLGDVMRRCGMKDGEALANCAVWRQEKYLRPYDTGSSDVISQVVRRFLKWAHGGFDQRFGMDVAEASALYLTLTISAKLKPAGAGSRANVDVTIRRWVLVDAIDPGMPVEVGHFDAPASNTKRVRPRAAYRLPRDVQDAVEAYLLAYEPGHARAYVDSWRRAQEITP